MIDRTELERAVDRAVNVAMQPTVAWWENSLAGLDRCEWTTADGWRCVRPDGHAGVHQDASGRDY